MKYHIALSRPFNLEDFNRNAKAGKCPRHTMLSLSQYLGATVHQPEGNPISLLDKMRAKITGSEPEHWALARKLSSQLKSDDMIFSIGEDVGFPIAAVCGAKQKRPQMSVFVHNIDRPRGRLSLKLFDLGNRIDLFMTNTSVKADFLRKSLKLPEERVYLVTEQTDTQFFVPGSSSPNKSRPIIGSGGLEQRDYKTLAEATKDLGVDVKICAMSPNARPDPEKFPNVIPDNMTIKKLDWPDLVQHYRDSDVVVISLQQHNYQAGLTTLFESMACRRPVVMTRTPGLVEELADSGIVSGVSSGDATGMQQAILDLLNNPEKAQSQAQRGYELVVKEYNSEQYVKGIAEYLKSM